MNVDILSPVTYDLLLALFESLSVLRTGASVGSL